MADKTEEIEDLDQETIDCLDKYMSITPPTPIIKPSPWDEKRLISLREINAPDVLYSTDGITIENDGKPTIIPRDQIQPPAYGNARQVRVSMSIDYPLVESYRESIGTEGFKYQCPLPVVEKLEKPIKKLDGEGYYYYRLVDGRHRYHATLEYLDFPCYLVSGHEADIELLAQKLNNPKTWESGWSNDDASVMSTIKKQMEYHKETDGEKGVKSDVDSIMDYVKEHFPSTAKTDRRKFAERCLSSAGIQQDIENKDNAQWATVLKENFNGEVVNDGSMDTRGNIGIALRRGRRSDEISAYIKMAESLISYYQEDPNNIPSHYYIGSISMGQGVSKDKEPTTQNLDQLRDNAYGCFTREFLKSIVLPLAEMYENQMLHEPDIRFVSQNNGTGETPDKLY